MEGACFSSSRTCHGPFQPSPTEPLDFEAAIENTITACVDPAATPAVSDRELPVYVGVDPFAAP
jgi:hypothetical protein